MANRAFYLFEHHISVSTSIGFFRLQTLKRMLMLRIRTIMLRIQIIMLRIQTIVLRIRTIML